MNNNDSIGKLNMKASEIPYRTSNINFNCTLTAPNTDCAKTLINETLTDVNKGSLSSHTFAMIKEAINGTLADVKNRSKPCIIFHTLIFLHF